MHIYEISNIKRNINNSNSILNYFLYMEHNLTDVIVQRCSLATSLIHVYENHNDCIFMNINENIVSMVTNNIKEISAKQMAT